MALVPNPHTPCAVPNDFDDAAYHAIQKNVSQFVNEPAWESYAGAINAVGFRFAAMDESHDRFVAAISDEKAFHPAGPRFRQEEALFAFFVNGCSTVECLYFALFNIAACIRPQKFSALTAKDLRDVNPKEVVKRFAHAFPSDPFTELLRTVKNSSELAAMAEHRNYLVHRGAPARHHELGMFAPGSVVDIGAAKSAMIASNPQAPPTDWLKNLSLSAEMTNGPRTWIGQTVSEIMRSAVDWLARAVPPQAHFGR